MDMMHMYSKFFEVVLAKFRAIGPVVMFKCCRNFIPHLRGNVYVEFSEERYAHEAVKLFNGYCHEGKQLEVELCPVSNWREAICKCQANTFCNFLHVFRNPADEFDVPKVEDRNAAAVLELDKVIKKE